MKNLKHLFYVATFLLLTNLYAQKPTEVPKPDDTPIDLSNPSDLIIYIVLPLCAILLYFLYKRNKKNHTK